MITKEVKLMIHEAWQEHQVIMIDYIVEGIDLLIGIDVINSLSGGGGGCHDRQRRSKF